MIELLKAINENPGPFVVYGVLYCIIEDIIKKQEG